MRYRALLNEFPPCESAGGELTLPDNSCDLQCQIQRGWGILAES
jgi:hypothetical protein